MAIDNLLAQAEAAQEEHGKLRREISELKEALRVAAYTLGIQYNLLIRWLYPVNGIHENAEQMHQLAVETVVALPEDLRQASPNRAELAMHALATMLEAQKKLRAP